MTSVCNQWIPIRHKKRQTSKDNQKDKNTKMSLEKDKKLFCVCKYCLCNIQVCNIHWASWDLKLKFKTERGLKKRKVYFLCKV